MKLTRNLWIFFMIDLASTLFLVTDFKYGWFSTVTRDENTFSYESFMPILYFVTWAVCGWLLLKFDHIRGTRKNLELYYHGVVWVNFFIGAIYAAVIMEAWRNPFIFVLIVVPAVVMLSIHWFIYRNKPKGIDTKAVFK